MGLLNRVFHGRDEAVPQSHARIVRTGGPAISADDQPQVGKVAGRPKFFGRFARDYLIPADRPAAQYAAASSGGGVNAAATFLNGRKVKDRIDLDLTTARTDYSINISGSVVVYADSTAGTDRLNVRFATSDGDQAGPLVPFRPGQFIGGERYSRLLVSNAAQAGSTATLLIVEDRPGDEFSYR